MAKPILDQLAEGPVLGDGGYVFILKERGVPMVTMSCKPELRSGWWQGREAAYDS